jgi:hypothetical protein
VIRKSSGAAKAGAPALVTLKENGSRQVPEIIAAVENASAAELRKLAQGLLKDGSHRGDLTLWGPLLARWAEIDGTGLIAFVQKEVPPANRGWLLAQAWYAWGAADPRAAFAAGGELPPELGKKLVAGMVEKDPRLAVEAALKMPDAQFNILHITKRLGELAPELISGLLPRAVYDGMRFPLQNAQTDQLVKTDPAAAIAAAKKAGAIAWDPVPPVMTKVARNDPARAAALLTEMPPSRSRALSSLAVAGAWAAQDAPAALAWARKSLTGPVKQAALLEIAAASGGPDPAAALQLVQEAGWTMDGDFHRVADNGHFSPSETNSRRTSDQTAAMLLKQIAVTDPAAAKQYLEQSVPEEHRSAVATAAGLSK